jgi:hypothetical protein
VSFAAIRWALGVSAGGELPPAAALLLVVLADYYNPEYGCFPSQAALSERLGLSQSQVRRNLRLLVRIGLVKLASRGRRNEYRLQLNRASVHGESENIFTNSAHGCTVNTAHGCTVGGDDTAHGCTVAENLSLYALTSNPDQRTSKGKAGSSCGSPATEFPEILEPGYERNPETDPEEAPEVKIEDVLAAMAPKTEAQALEDFALARKNGKAVTAGMLGKLWRDLNTVHHPKFKTGLTQQKLGQLKSAYRLAGEPFLAALPLVIARWSEFLLYLKVHGSTSGAKGFDNVNAPTPHIGLVLSCVEQAVNFKLEHDKKLVPSAPLAKPAPLNEDHALTNGIAYLQTVNKPSKEEALALLEAALKGE